MSADIHFTSNFCQSTNDSLRAKRNKRSRDVEVPASPESRHVRESVESNSQASTIVALSPDQPLLLTTFFQQPTDTSDDPPRPKTPPLALSLVQPTPSPNTALLLRAMESSDDDVDRDDAQAIGAAQPRPKEQRHENRNEGASTEVLDIVALPWKSRSRTIRIFEAFFFSRLHSDVALWNAFRPFMSKKGERRVSSFFAENIFIPTRMNLPEIPTAIDSVSGDMQLRQYQREGVHFLLKQFCFGTGAILGDDLGLGKSAQVCAFLEQIVRLFGVKGPHLLLVPLSTINSWMREFQRWAPSLSVLNFRGNAQERARLRISNHVVLCTPATFRSDSFRLRKIRWVVSIVDEAHQLRGGTSSVNHQMAKLSSCFRLGITGTPIQNSPTELWGLVYFLFPCLGKLKIIDQTQSVDRYCSDLLERIMIRRLKGELNLGIPEKFEAPVILLEPTSLQRSMYVSLLEVEGNDFSKFMGLRKICNHPMLSYLLPNGGSETNCRRGLERLKEAGVPLTEEALIHSSAKMKHLDSILPKMREEGHRILIFSNFRAQLDLLEGYCTLRNFSYERLDGLCSRVERELAMIRFNSKHSKIFCFLITTTAGGVGITLTGADTVFLFDAHFNPQHDRQAADRAHRLGQVKPVSIFRMAIKGSIEEAVLARAAIKADTGDVIVDGRLQHTLHATEMRKIVQNQKDFLHTGGIMGHQSIPLQPFTVDAVGLKLLEMLIAGLDNDGINETSVSRQISTPRVACRRCTRKDEDGINILCSQCGTNGATCFDCLPGRYLCMSGGDGITLPRLTQIPPVRSMKDLTFYYQCPKCSGEVGSGSDEEDEDEGEEDAEDIDDE